MPQEWEILIKDRLKDFLRELSDVCLHCGRKIEDIKVVYATKYLDPKQFVIFISICKEIGIVPVVIGENRVQEAEVKMNLVREKRPELLKDFSLMMIGTLQKNKTNKAIRLFSEIHSIDSLELAKVADTHLGREKKSMPVFLEVNVSGKATKHGFLPDEINEMILQIKSLKYLELKGLMTMAPLVSDPEQVRSIFRSLKQLADKYNLLTSMGMSNDWRVAIEEGADMIRIGSRLFAS